MDRWLRTSFLSRAATVVLVIGALYFGQSVLAPLAVAILLSVVLSGAVTRVERLGFRRWRIGRIASVLLVALGISAAFAGTAWIVVNQGSELAEQAPAYQRTLLAKIREPIVGLNRVMRQVRVASTTGRVPASTSLELVPRDADLVSTAAGWVGSIASFAGMAGVVVVLLIFLLIEREDLRDRLLRIAGRGEMRLTGSTLREASERVARYLRSLTLLNVGHGIAVGTGLALIGLPGALLFGLLAGLLRFVPFAGPTIAAIAPLAMSVAAFDGWTTTLWVVLFLGTLELVSNNVVEPWLYGTSVGLSPFAVILSAIFWAWLWGPIGLVLATPLTVCLVVMGRNVSGLETISILLSDSRPLHSYERVYERLVARDLDSATALIAERKRDETPVETWDSTLIPALRLLDRDRQTRELEGDDLVFSREAFDTWIADLAETEEPIESTGGAILCVPTSAFGDEIVSAGLARLLEVRGLRTRALARLPTSETVAVVKDEEDAIVCLSALDSSAIPLRHLVRRLRTGAPRRRFVVGLWGEDALRVSQLRAALAGDANIEFVSSLGEMVQALGGGAELVLSPPASPAARDARAPGTC